MKFLPNLMVILLLQLPPMAAEAFGNIRLPWAGPERYRLAVIEFFEAEQTQRWGVIVTLVYFAVFSLIKKHGDANNAANFYRREKFVLTLQWLLVILSAVWYFGDYSRASSSTEVLIFLAAIAFSVALRAWFRMTPFKTRFCDMFFWSLFLLLFWAAFVRLEFDRAYLYRGLPRISGPWKNPNTFGLLMAIGVLLTSHFLTVTLKCAEGNSMRKVKIWLLACAMLAFAVHLLGSFSRGAWLACLLSCLYLWLVPASRFWNLLKRERLYCLLFIVASVSACVLAFWTLRHTEVPVIRRTFSVGNINDFSWRNRVDAWSGALRIAADGPLHGCGWQKPVAIYENYYMPARLTEGRAIKLNDYFTVAMSIGPVGLILLALIIWGQLWEPGAGRPLDAMERAQDRLCRAVTFLFLVGFWFDGGLFHSPAAFLFWAFIELRSSAASDRAWRSSELCAA